MSGSYKKILAGAVFLALFSLPCQAATPVQTAPVASDAAEVVARVNGKDFTRENLKTAVNNLLPTMSYHSSVSEERFKQLQKTAVDQMINRHLIYEAAKKTKEADPSNKEIDAEIDKIKKRLPKGQTLDKVLKNSKMTMADLKSDIKRKIVIDGYIKKKAEEFKKKADSTINEAYVKDYYQKNLDKFKEPEQIHLRSILLKADPSGGQKVWNEVQKKAKDVVKQARSGEDFQALVKKYSEDPYKDKGGDMGWAHKGSLLEEIDAAADKLKVGEVSDPVMTIYGYHIVKLEGKKPSVQRKFEEINREKLEKELEGKEYKKLWDDWTKELRSTAKIEILVNLNEVK